MNRTWLLWLGMFATVLASWLGLVIIPNWQIRELQPVTVTNSDGQQVHYPQALDATTALVGEHVYRSQGCVYCHSQQIRPEGFGADILRGWGERRSVPRDYLFQSPPLLGTMRTGPDVANIGSRQPAEAWHHLHLFDARLVSPGSIMPPFKYLYTVTTTEPRAGLQVSHYRLPDTYYGKPAWITPNTQATALVAYLQALRQEHSYAEVQ